MFRKEAIFMMLVLPATLLALAFLVALLGSRRLRFRAIDRARLQAELSPLQLFVGAR
jgi:hypothetical protein